MQRPFLALSLISLSVALAACGGGEGTVGTPGVAVTVSAAPSGGTTATSTVPTQTLTVTPQGNASVSFNMLAAADVTPQTAPLGDALLYVATLTDANASPTVDVSISFLTNNVKSYIISVGLVGGGSKLQCVGGGWSTEQLQALSGDSDVTPVLCNGTVTIDPVNYTIKATNVTLVEAVANDGSSPNPTAVTSFWLALPKPAAN